MAKQDDALFEESSQGAVSAITALSFVLAVVLVFGGMVLFSYGFDGGTQDMWVFVAGLTATIVGFMLPFAFLSASGK